MVPCAKLVQSGEEFSLVGCRDLFQLTGGSAVAKVVKVLLGSMSVLSGG